MLPWIDGLGDPVQEIHTLQGGLMGYIAWGQRCLYANSSDTSVLGVSGWDSEIFTGIRHWVVVVNIRVAIEINNVIITEIPACDLTLDPVVNDMGTSNISQANCITRWLPRLDQLATPSVSKEQTDKDKQNPTCLYLIYKEWSARAGCSVEAAHS
jgi:hypothetical protein